MPAPAKTLSPAELRELSLRLKDYVATNRDILEVEDLTTIWDAHRTLDRLADKAEARSEKATRT
jgi:hypothetical protein